MTTAQRGFRRYRAAALVAATLLCPPWGSSRAAEKLAVMTFSASDGLGSSFVSHISQDAAGYIWFATRDGLSRWNGYEFTTFSQDAGFTSPAVDTSCQTRSGAYFVIANDGSLYSYDPAHPGTSSRRGMVTFLRRTVSFNGQDVRFTRLYEDRHGVLWGGGQGVLVRGVGSTDTVIPLSPLPSEGPLVIVQALVEDQAGTLWIGTSRGLFRLLPDGRTAHYSLGSQTGLDVVTALAADHRGMLWIGHSWLGVLVFNPGPAGEPTAHRQLDVTAARDAAFPGAPRPGQAVLFDRRNGLPDSRVLSLLVGSTGQVWVGTGRGLARFDGTAVASFTKANGLSDDLIQALAEDGDGNLWIGTPTGAMRVLIGGFSAYTPEEGLGTDHAVGIGEISPGVVFSIGIDWSISVFNGQRFHAAQMLLPPGSSAMWASQVAYRDRSGRWWALTNQGLYRFDTNPSNGLPASRGPVRHYGPRDGLPNGHVFRLYEDRAGTLWVGTRSGDPADDGLLRFAAGQQRMMPLGQSDGLPARIAPSAFAEDARGNLWVGFYSGGVARYRAGRFRTYGAADGIPPGMVTALLVDATGRLWIATNAGGLGRVDDPSADTLVVRRYGTTEGLASNNVRAVTEDRAGRIFAGSVRGVDRLDPSTGRIRHYGRSEGLASDFVTAAYCDSQGELWFGSYGGVFRLRGGTEPDEEPPPVVVTGLRVAGERFPVLELGESAVGPIVLEADQRDIGIEFLSLSRRRPYGVSYQYSIDPRGGAWSPPAAARSVNFARLPPGDYLFAVRAITRDRTVSRTPATVALTIRPPVWQRWWALSLMAAGLAGILLILHRYRVRRLLEVERLRMAIAADLHDDVATNLSSIATFSTLVRSSLETPSPLLDRITVLATESVEAIREIIWSVDPKPETIASLLVRLHDAFATACRSRGIHLVVTPPSEHVGGNLTAAQRKHLWLMLKEAVSNAIQHSEGTAITVTVARAGRHVRFTVSDNGTGLASDAGSKGRGLATMKARAASLGGTVTVTSPPGGGTTVEFVTARFD